VDSFDKAGNRFEIKSSTKTSITTARDVGVHTLRHWRTEYWVIAVGENPKGMGFQMHRLYIAHPSHLEPFFSELESKLTATRDRCEDVLAAAEGGGADPQKVEEVRRILNRGITKNNPHIPKKLVERLTPLDAKDSRKARAQLRRFVRQNPIK
jgi:hypothetical protein